MIKVPVEKNYIENPEKSHYFKLEHYTMKLATISYWKNSKVKESSEWLEMHVSTMTTPTDNLFYREKRISMTTYRIQGRLYQIQVAQVRLSRK